MNCIAYLRVSSHSQLEKGDSIDGQRNYIESWAKNNNHSIERWYIDDGKSAFNGKREQYELMLNELDNDVVQAEAIVVYSLSRFSRNLRSQLSSLEKLNSLGIKLISTTESLPEAEDDSYMMSTMLGLMNEQYSRQNAKVVCHRLKDTARKGYFTGGPIPFGYISVGVNGDTSKHRKILQIFEEEAVVVKDIFQMSDHGDSGLGIGVKNIAKILNQRGDKRRGTVWNRNSVHRILTNPAYCGNFIFGKNSSEPITVLIPQIISKEQFNRVQDGLKERDFTSTENKKFRSNSLLTGILICPQCGSSMVVTSGKSGKYKYYQCSLQVRQSPDKCSSKRIRKDIIEPIVKEKFCNQLLTEERLKTICKLAREVHKLASKELLSEQLKLTKRISQAKEKSYRLISLIAQGTLEPSKQINDQINDYTITLERLEFQLQQVKRKLTLPVKNFGKRRIEEFAIELKQHLTEIDDASLKQLMLATLNSIEGDVSEKKIRFRGSNMAMLYIIANAKTGTDFSVPVFVTKWRRDRDLNPRYA
ncbi:TPA: recombinase family protein, partial [Vibrio parahaemolyticus]|nr:recombinase family protein [Vibrio parahaemolyticus]